MGELILLGKRLLFIALLVVFACEEEQEKDCTGIINGSSVCGCTDSISSNYDSTATHDDGSCLDCAGVEGGNNVCGCTNSLATNYNQDATFDNGSCSFCGSGTSFSRIIPGSSGQDIVKSPGCTYTVCSTDGKTMLINIDEFGNTIWTRTYSEISGNHTGKSVNHTADGGYIIGAGQNSIIKADSLGEMEWFKKLSYSATHYVEDAIQTSDGDYMVVGGVGGDPGTGGHGQKGQAFIVRMSEGGSIQWVRRYGISNTPMDNFYGIVQADDGGFVVVGEKLQDRNFEFYDHYWILKIDGNGNIEWENELGSNYWDEAMDIAKLSDDNYVVTGKKSLSTSNLNIWIMRIASDGSILWQSNFGNSNYDTGISITVNDAENMVVTAGYTRSSGTAPWQYKIVAVDASNGQLVWNKLYGGGQDDKAYGVVSSYDQGFAVVGVSRSFGSDYVNWLVKTDPDGNLTED